MQRSEGQSGWSATARQLFGVDLRSLAAFRIGAAVVLLADLALRSRDLTAFYTDLGVLPRVSRIELYEFDDAFGFSHMWSLHMCSGQFWVQALLLLVAACFGVALLVGYRTRLAAGASWLLLLSLDARNPMILNSGDVLFRCMLFWSLFLPLNGAWSLDGLLRPAAVPRPSRAFSFASAGLLLQPQIMYLFSAGFKTHPAWLTERSAVYYALHCDAYATALGVWLRQFPRLMEWLTVSSYVLEIAGPVLVFFPLANRRIRLVLIPIFWLFHLGLGATLTVGLFVPICLLAWVPFLPDTFWDACRRRCAWPRLGERLERGAETLRRREWLVRAERPRWTNRVLVECLLACLLVYTILWNIREWDVARYESWTLPRQWNGVARALGFDQNWSMFSPIPRTEDGWLVMRGVLRDGRAVNLWQPSVPLPWEKPERVSAQYRSQRWRKYLDNLTTESHAAHRMPFANWLHWRWNRQYAQGRPEHEVVEVQLVHRVERTPPPGTRVPDPESRILWTWYYE